MKKLIVIFGIVIFLSLVAGVIYYFFEKSPSERNSTEIQTAHPPCLGDNEVVTYEVKKKKRNLGDTEANVIISIRDSKDDRVKYSFQINNLFNDHSFEIHECGIYALRMFNYDPQKTKQLPGYKDELWRYDYGGEGRPLILFSEKPEEFISYYSPVFRVDPREIYIALGRGYLGREDYALIIKDLNLRVDSFVLLRQTLLEKYPDLLGHFGLEKWTKNGDYFWGDLFMGADEIAYLRILRDIWKLDVLPVPGGTLGGTAFNPEYGYVTYDTGPGWIGIDVIAEQIYEEWRKEGKKIDFYLYNLFTKEKTLLATTDDPSWSFKPEWLSDTELQYELPTGQKKIYRINE